jgi:O-antigen ligase
MEASDSNAPVVGSGATWRRRLEPLVDRWASSSNERLARGLALAAAACLFLESTGTVDLVYTIRPSYALMGAALLAGAPFVWRGWRSVPFWIRVTGGALLVVYVVAMLGGDQLVLPGSGRGGAYRDVVYVADLAFGLAALGLIAGLSRTEREVRTLLVALVVGATLASLYGLYQWPAQHFGWPAADILTTNNSNGIAAGGGQGVGLFGWERVRSTFLEAHFLASYLAAILPLAFALALRSRGHRRVVTLVASGAIAICLALTASAPAWGALVIGTLVALALIVIARGWPALAGPLAGVLVLTLLALVPLATSPELFASVTGRARSELTVTSSFRTETWDQVASVWSQRPALGYGPGQSSIQLAEVASPGSAAPGVSPPLVSAQGLWAASVIDGGVLALSAWVLFLGGVLLLGARTVLRAPTVVNVAVFVAAVTALLESQLTGDRLYLASWVLAGALLATAIRQPRPADGSGSDDEPGPGADQR